MPISIPSWRTRIPSIREDRRARYKGMSFFVVEREWDGVSVGKPFDKMGQHASDTAEVVFDNVRVPATHILGEEGTGFRHGDESV